MSAYRGSPVNSIGVACWQHKQQHIVIEVDDGGCVKQSQTQQIVCEIKGDIPSQVPHTLTRTCGQHVEVPSWTRNSELGD